MKKTNLFFDWFRGLGGDTANFKTEEITNNLNAPIFLVSTFKTRAEEIKEKYNHKFKTN